jgi:hypothetical protein
MYAFFGPSPTYTRYSGSIPRFISVCVRISESTATENVPISIPNDVGFIVFNLLPLNMIFN